MAERKSIQEKHQEISHLKSLPVTEHTLKQLQTALRSKTNIISAKAAEVVEYLRLQEFLPDLIQCFQRFCLNPAVSDKGCHAKTAAVSALKSLDCGDAEIYLKGIRIRQLEPAFGGPVDTAATLRMRCAEALVQINHPQMMPELVRMMADPEPAPRKAAANLLTVIGSDAAELLLTLKIFLGDKNPEVTGDCMQDLISMEPLSGITVASEFLNDSNPVLATESAMAIGQSGHPEGFRILKQCWETALGSEAKQRLCLPIAFTRLDDAFDFLIAVIQESYSALAEAALRSMTVYGADPIRLRAVKAAVDARQNPTLSRLFSELFSDRNHSA